MYLNSNYLIIYIYLILLTTYDWVMLYNRYIFKYYKWIYFAPGTGDCMINSMKFQHNRWTHKWEKEVEIYDRDTYSNRQKHERETFARRDKKKKSATHLNGAWQGVTTMESGRRETEIREGGKTVNNI